MAALVADDFYLIVNSVNMSSFASEITTDFTREELDETTFGDDTKFMRPGLKSWSINVTFFQNYAGSTVDPTIWPLIDNGTAFAVELRPTSGAVSTTNPKYTSAVAYAFSYSNPVGGSIGQMATVQITIKPGKGGDFVRATA